MTSRLNSSPLSDSTVSPKGLKNEKRFTSNTSTNFSANNSPNSKKSAIPVDNSWSISGWLNSVAKREKKPSSVNNQAFPFGTCHNTSRNLTTDSQGEQQLEKFDDQIKEKRPPSTRSTTSYHLKSSFKLEDKFDALSLRESTHLNKYKSQIANKNLEKLRANSFKETHTYEPSKSPRLNRFFKELNENKTKYDTSSNEARGVNSLKWEPIRTKNVSRTKSFFDTNFVEGSLCGCDSNNNSILSPTQNDLNESQLESSSNIFKRSDCASYVNIELNEYFRVKSEEWRDYHHNLVDSHCHLEMIFTKLTLLSILFSIYFIFHFLFFYRLRYYKPIADYFDDFKAIYMRNFEACIDVICDPYKFKTKCNFGSILLLFLIPFTLFLVVQVSLDKYMFKYGHEKVRFTLGCHPHFANQWSEHTQSLIYSCLKGDSKIVAIGECGLDMSKKFLSNFFNAFLNSAV
jgi:hypothetical protein